MVLIFTDTTSVLSSEFVSNFSAEKLAVTLFRISEETGVEFSPAQRSFSIIGDWIKVNQAHAYLEEYFEKEHAKQNEKQEKESHFIGRNQMTTPIEGRRGRKPGCTVAKSQYNAVPEPFVQYHNDQMHISMGPVSHRKDSNDSDIKIDNVDCIDTSIEPEKKSESVIKDIEKDEPLIKSKHEPYENDKGAKNDTDVGDACITIKEEFDEDVMDDDTDVDEQYLEERSNVEKLESSYSTKLDPNVEVKIEIVLDDETDSLKSRRKSKPKKLIPAAVVIKDEDDQGQITNSPKLKRGKGRPKLPENNTVEGKKKRKRKKKVKKTEDVDYKCDKCEYIGKKKENLREHTQRMHRNKFACETCFKKFGLHKDLLRHTRHVHTNPQYHCKVCDKFYKFSRAYKEHMLSHEDNYVKPQFECEICHKVFSTKYVLTAHVKSEHLGMKKSFMCPTCGRSFTQKNSYLMHANVHAGIKPYVCDVCGKAFSYDKSLKEHKYMHDDERRFSCHICAKTFRQKTSLLMHMKVHKEARDYICTSCGKGFTQKQALLRHERIHSGDKPFKCALCSRSFNDYSIIRRHMMMHHKRDKDPKTWRGDIICSLKRKTEFYIEGGPGYNGGERLPTVEMGTEPAGGAKSVFKSPADALDKLVIETVEPDSDFTSQNGDSFTNAELPDNPESVSHQDTEKFVPSNSENQTSLSDCSGVRSSYQTQCMSEKSEAVSKIPESEQTASPSLPINYSMPPSYPTSVPVTTGPSTDSEGMQRQYQDMIDSYRMQGQRRDIFMQNLTSISGLPPQSHQLPSVPGETSQGQPLPNPWGLPGYPPYYSPANFSHYQGPQS